VIGRSGLIGAVLLLALSAWFAGLNASARVPVDLGLVRFSRVSVPVLVFGAVLLGMLVMLIAGVRSDIHVRRILTERLADEDRMERAWRDRAQQDLFQDVPDEVESPDAPATPDT